MTRIQNLFYQTNFTSLELALADNVAISCLNPLHCLRNHLVNNLFRRLPLVNNSGSFAHQEWPRVVECVVINVVTHLFHIVLDGDLASCREFLDFVLPILFPVLDVWVYANSEGTALEQQPVNAPEKIEGRKESLQ